MSTHTQKQRAQELLAIVSQAEQQCGSCGLKIDPGSVYSLHEKIIRCGSCNGWAELVLVPSGDAALTRRVSRFAAVAVPVCEWNRRRKRWERRGTLASEAAHAEAQAACALDAEKRERARARAQKRAAVKDEEYRAIFAQKVRQLYSGIPAGTEHIIAQHACEKYSGRVGRTAAAKELDDEMITLAVVAHIRHMHTDYDDLLLRGVSKADARQRIRGPMQEVLRLWRLPLTCADTRAEQNAFD